MTTNVLFIGGPADGWREVMRVTPLVWYVEELPREEPALFSGANAEVDHRRVSTIRHPYQFVPVTGGVSPGDIGLYVHSSVSNWAAALLDGYRKAAV